LVLVAQRVRELVAVMSAHLATILCLTQLLQLVVGTVLVQVLPLQVVVRVVVVKL
jgi:hypothetical protein